MLILPLGSAIPENARILSGILNVYSKKIRCAGQKEVFLQKEQRNSEPWNSELLVPISARKKGKKFMYLKRTFFLEKMLSFQS